jgi:site-specific recombinase XerD
LDARIYAGVSACLDGKAAPAIQPGLNRTKPGTFNALIAAYYGSPKFKGLRSSTQTTYRGIIERFREQHGEKRVARIERQQVKAIIGAMYETPAAANNMLNRLRALMTLAVDIEMRKDDPIVRLRGYANKSDGFHTWTEDEIAAFEARHEIGSKARLALALMLYTGQRRSDAAPVRIASPELFLKIVPLHH